MSVRAGAERDSLEEGTGIVGPLNPAIHGIRVASVFELSVSLSPFFFVSLFIYLYVCYIFTNLSAV